MCLQESNICLYHMRCPTVRWKWISDPLGGMGCKAFSYKPPYNILTNSERNALEDDKADGAVKGQEIGKGQIQGEDIREGKILFEWWSLYSIYS